MSNKNKRRAEAQVASADQNVEQTVATTEATETKAEAKKETMAAFLDRMIAEGGEIEKIVAAAKAEAASRGDRTKYNAGVIKGHINFRTKQAAKKSAKKEEAQVEE